jgi:hypothetical protein
VKPSRRYGAAALTCTSPLLHHALVVACLTDLEPGAKAVGAKLDPLDAHKFLQSVTEQQGAFLDYRLDAQGCLEAVVWALPEQVEAMQLYGDVWIQDNTCKTLAANRPFFAIVGVDGNSRYYLAASDLCVSAFYTNSTALVRQDSPAGPRGTEG